MKLIPFTIEILTWGVTGETETHSRQPWAISSPIKGRTLTATFTQQFSGDDDDGGGGGGEEEDDKEECDSILIQTSMSGMRKCSEGESRFCLQQLDEVVSSREGEMEKKKWRRSYFRSSSLWFWVYEVSLYFLFYPPWNSIFTLFFFLNPPRQLFLLLFWLVLLNPWVRVYWNKKIIYYTTLLRSVTIVSTLLLFSVGKGNKNAVR